MKEARRSWKDFSESRWSGRARRRLIPATVPYQIHAHYTAHLVLHMQALQRFLYIYHVSLHDYIQVQRKVYMFLYRRSTCPLCTVLIAATAAFARLISDINNDVLDYPCPKKVDNDRVPWQRWLNIRRNQYRSSCSS